MHSLTVCLAQLNNTHLPFRLADALEQTIRQLHKQTFFVSPELWTPKNCRRITRLHDDLDEIATHFGLEKPKLYT